MFTNNPIEFGTIQAAIDGPNRNGINKIRKVVDKNPEAGVSTALYLWSYNVRAVQNDKIGVFTDDTLIQMADGSVRKFGEIHVERRFREVMTSSGPAKVIAETETPPEI